MATAEQRARRRAQRATAKNVRSGTYQRQFSYSKQVQARSEDYFKNLLAHPEQITDADKPALARRASWAKWEGKKPGSHPGANPRWLKAWEEYFYHNV